MRVLFDGEAFLRHERSGITRYLAELVHRFRSDGSYGVEAITPYRFVASRHLTELFPGRFHRVPLPPRLRVGTLRQLNGTRRRSAPPAVDLVHHSLYEPAALDLAPGAARVCGIYDFTLELYPQLFPGWDRAVADKEEYLKRCDGLLCISQTTRDDLVRLHPEIDKPIEVTPLGVAENFGRPRPGRLRGIPDDYVLHVGSRFAHKNIGLVFEAVARLAQREPALHIVLSGNPLTAGERERLQDLGIADRVVRVKVSDADLPRLYADARAFVFPSRYEGFGVPVLESMAAGCPTVVSRAPALLEITDGAALDVDADDPDGLAEAIHRLGSDRVLAARLVEAGRGRAAGFGWDRTARTSVAAYDRIRRQL